ncbi:hypothetical protein V494_01007 [Pseudogymnoascus sp. VKM F-4513 (FW-928)]|nr:hypothetical protein V494_01007 [Pseudogymnoascus sp. VKM F-4513 (FW-928)]
MDSRDFPLSSQLKRQIISRIFANSENIIESSSNSQSYFAYYQKWIDEHDNCLTQSHIQITELITILKDPIRTRNLLWDALKARVPSQELANKKEIIEESINLAVRLLLMVPTGGSATVGRSITLSGETKLSWSDGTIRDLISKKFAPQNNIKERVKLERIFNAANLEQIGGIEVRWTSNFADHLRMRDDDKAVEIFHYATFLKLHQSCDVFPKGLVEETIRTLALLLPEHDGDVEKWFYSHESKIEKRGRLPLDPLARECGQLKAEARQIEHFQYWHDRLVILKQVFDEAEPKSIKQWWRDRRRGVQWYTFWVAALVLALTIIFGLVQCIEGGLQVWLSYKGLD